MPNRGEVEDASDDGRLAVVDAALVSIRGGPPSEAARADESRLKINEGGPQPDRTSIGTDERLRLAAAKPGGRGEKTGAQQNQRRGFGNS